MQNQKNQIFKVNHPFRIVQRLLPVWIQMWLSKPGSGASHNNDLIWWPISEREL